MADKGGYIGRNPGDGSVIIARQQFLPTGIQTDFTFNSGYTPGFMDVFLNGVKLVDVRDYAATTGNTVGLTSHANSGDIVELIAYKAFNLGNVTNATNDFAVGGNLTVSGDVDVDGHTELDDINVSGASTIANLVSTVSSGIVTISNTTDSTSTTTGALLVSGGVGVALSMTVGGNLSVGGTVTYEDVTNVDSIGIITAGKGLRSTTGGLVVTAGVSTFAGDVSIADKIIHTGDTNTALRFPSADTITAETGGSERLRVSSAGLVGIGTNSNWTIWDLQVKGGVGISSGTTGHQALSLTKSAIQSLVIGSSYTNLSLNPDGGHLLLNTTTDYADANSDDLQIYGTADTGMSITSGTSNYGSIYFGDSTSANSDRNRGIVRYGHGADAMEFWTAASERIRIDSSGRLLIGTTTEGYSSGDDLTIATAGHTGITIRSGTTHEGAVYFSDATTGGGEYIGSLVYSHNTNAMVLTTNGSERIRIDSSGNIGMGDAAPEYPLHLTNDTEANLCIETCNDSATNFAGIRLRKSRGTNSSPTIVSNGDDLAHIFAYGYDGNSYEQSSKIIFEVDNTPGDGDMPGRILFSTTPDGSTSPVERLRIDSVGMSKFTRGSTGTVAHFYANARESNILLQNDAVTWKIVNYDYGDDGTDNLGFHDGSADRLVIAKTGKIGINETVPVNMLHIKESNPFIELQGTAASSGDTGIYLNANANHWIIKADNYTSGNQFAIKQGDTSSSSNRLSLDSNGNMALNVAFKSWHANNKAVIQGNGGYAILGRSDNQLIIAQNYYYDSSDAGKYIAAGEASLYSQKDGDHLFYAAASGSADASASQVLRAVINSDGMAISSSNTATTAGYALRVEATHASGGNVAQFYNNDGSDNYGGLIINAGTTNKECRLITAYGDSFMTFYTETSGGSQVEAFRITSDQQVLFSTDNTTYGETFAFKNIREDEGMYINQNSSNDYSGVVCRHGRGLSGYTGRMFNFKRNDGTTVGSIDIGASSTAYNTTSDRRLKENETVITDSIVKLKQLKPYEFTFKDDPGPVHQGFFADEVQDVIPNGVVTGDRNAVYTEENATNTEQVGDIKAQSLDYGKLTPLLTAALQEAISKIETLETEVASLKSQINN